MHLWGEAAGTMEILWVPRQVVPQAFGGEGLHTGEAELKSGAEK